MSGKKAHTGSGNGKDGRLRLLNAAEELFADKGLDATSIRDLTTKAHCNLALVNYHFGDKKQLYEELFRERLRKMRDSRLSAVERVMTDKNNRSLEKLLRAYAIAFLEPFADRGRSERFMRLFARELVDQQLPKSMFIEEMAAPVMKSLEEALNVICPKLEKHDVQMNIHSIVGQLVHVMHLKTMFEDRHAQAVAAFDVDEAIDHIVKFSSAGIRAFTKGNQK